MTSAYEIMMHGLEPSAIDISIMRERMRPLPEEEIEALGKAKLKMPKIYPYFEIKEIRIKGKEKLVPFIGIKGEF